jgi:hypothetical protein
MDPVRADDEVEPTRPSALERGHDTAFALGEVRDGIVEDVLDALLGRVAKETNRSPRMISMSAITPPESPRRSALMLASLLFSPST